MTNSPPSGFLLANKPWGASSFQLVSAVRSKLIIKKVGHAGTLDPLATGLLVLLIGRNWTKQQASFLQLPKTYTCQAVLGWRSTSLDLETVPEQLNSPIPNNISRPVVSSALNQLLGDSEQIVPSFSAVKYQGQPLYQLARAGQMVTKTKQINVTNIELLDLAPYQPSLPSKQPDHYRLATPYQRVATNAQTVAGWPAVSFQVKVSSGTYIRSLVETLGELLTTGAIMTQLSRTSIGKFHLSQAIDPLSKKYNLHSYLLSTAPTK